MLETPRSRRTASARTGTWSVLLRCKALGNKLNTPFHFFELLSPRFTVPDLDVVADAGDHYFASEARVRDQRRRHHHAPLLVELGLGGAREHETVHLARLLAEGAEALELAPDEGIPGVAGEHEETAVEPTRDHDPALEVLAELDRERESVLV